MIGTCDRMRKQTDLNWKQEKIAQFKQLKAEEKTGYERQRIKAKLDKLKKL